MVKPPEKKADSRGKEATEAGNLHYVGHGLAKIKPRSELTEEIRREFQPSLGRFLKPKTNPSASSSDPPFQLRPDSEPVSHGSREDSPEGFDNLEDCMQNLEMDSDHSDDLEDEIQEEIVGRTNETNRKRSASNWNRALKYMIRTHLTGESLCDPERCKGLGTGAKKLSIWTISLTGFDLVEFTICRCAKAMSTLLRDGWFPASPVRPSVAFHVDYLEFFDNIITKGSCSKMAFVEASRRMWSHRNRTTLPEVIEQFYCAYSQWGEMIASANQQLDSKLSSVTSLSFSRTDLAQLCPACMSREPGSADEEAPLILATDGNFQHRRLKVATLKGQRYTAYSHPCSYPRA